MAYLWSWFCQVKTGEPLTYTELRNFSDMMCIDLQAWEVEAIMHLDRLHRDTYGR